MIKELEEEREESQDPEIEFAIAGAVRECGGLEIILSMIQVCGFTLSFGYRKLLYLICSYDCFRGKICLLSSETPCMIENCG